MTVYQIRGASGEYEDYHEWMVGTYLHKEVAQKRFKEISNKIKEEYKCLNCPYNLSYPEKPIITDCPRHKPVNMWEDDNEKLVSENRIEPEYDCENRHDDYDKPSFWIDEIEVDEN